VRTPKLAFFTVGIFLLIVAFGTVAERKQQTRGFVESRAASLEGYATELLAGIGRDESGGELEWFAYTLQNGDLVIEFSGTLSNQCVDKILQTPVPGGRGERWYTSDPNAPGYLRASTEWRQSCWREHGGKLVRCAPEEVFEQIIKPLEYTGCFSGLALVGERAGNA